MNLGTYNTIGPDWSNLSKIRVFTILGIDKDENVISFRENSEHIEETIKQIQALVGNINWIIHEHKDSISVIPDNILTAADGVFTTEENSVCAVVTADCLPIVFANNKQTEIGITHTGWRGLTTPILTNMIDKFNDDPGDISVWIGPGIGQSSYEVGNEVRETFLSIDKEYDDSFKRSNENKYLMDLCSIAKIQLIKAGISSSKISGAKWDTYSNKLFHSARRDGEISGRMLTLAYIESSAINKQS